jgi:predicted  nucleic acid-binding Zn-ribbon protein
MNSQVHDLVLVQELDALLEDLESANGEQQEEALGFCLRDWSRIRLKREQLVAGIGADLLRRYARLRERYPRAVVGTRGGVCLGCNTLRPTAMASRASALDTCERCGRILFRVEPVSPAASLPARAGAGSVAVSEASAPSPRSSSQRRAPSRAARR